VLLLKKGRQKEQKKKTKEVAAVQKKSCYCDTTGPGGVGQGPTN
jgi:hypothetical protein